MLTHQSQGITQQHKSRGMIREIVTNRLKVFVNCLLFVLLDLESSFID
jgi:hypothetical protein